MQAETHAMKLVVCVDATMEPACLAGTMAALERLRQKLARTSTLCHCMELAVLGFDELGFTIRPLAPLGQGEPLPPCLPPYAGRWVRSTAIRYPTFDCNQMRYSLMTNAILKLALDTAAGHGTPTHTVLVLLTQCVVSPEARARLLFSGTLTPEQMQWLSLLELFALNGIGHPKAGGVTLVPFCVNAPAQQVLAVNASAGRPAVSVPVHQLDACFDRLRLLLLRILSYAPGKAPVVEDLPAQFRPDQPLAYPAASPLEFAPVVLGWNEGNDLCGS